MPLVDTISGTVTVPTAVIGAVAAVYNGGTTNVVKAFNTGKAYLLQMWKNGQAANGYLRVTAPSFHDQINGITHRVPFTCVSALQPWGYAQEVKSQEVLNFQLSGSAVAGDIEPFIGVVYYDAPESAQGRYIDLKEFERTYTGRMITVPIALAGTVGAWMAAPTAITGGVFGNLFKANTNYAFVGITGITETAIGNATAISITGPDTGNVRFSVPVPIAQSAGGTASPGGELTKQWSWDLTKYSGKPCIPLINSAQAGATFADVLINENADTVTCSLLFAEMQKSA